MTTCFLAKNLIGAFTDLLLQVPMHHGARAHVRYYACILHSSYALFHDGLYDTSRSYAHPSLSPQHAYARTKYTPFSLYPFPSYLSNGTSACFSLCDRVRMHANSLGMGERCGKGRAMETEGLHVAGAGTGLGAHV